MIVDEVSVLRDAYWLDGQNTDLCPEPGEPDYEIAEKLHEAGYLEISVVGRILEKPCYRLTTKGKPLASECYSIVEGERSQLHLRVMTALLDCAKARHDQQCD